MYYGGRSVDAAACLPTAEDTHDIENHWRAILEFAQQGQPNVHLFMELRASWRESPQERKLDPLLDPPGEAHLLRVSRLSRMGSVWRGFLFQRLCNPRQFCGDTRGIAGVTNTLPSISRR